MQPWLHYVPSGYNGWGEVERVVQFLQDHDSLARTIAENGRRFAATHLVSEGRHCYIKVRAGGGCRNNCCNAHACSP